MCPSSPRRFLEQISSCPKCKPTVLGCFKFPILKFSNLDDSQSPILNRRPYSSRRTMAYQALHLVIPMKILVSLLEQLHPHNPEICDCLGGTNDYLNI